MMKKILCVMLFNATLAQASTCEIPKPFRLLDESAAKPFQSMAPKSSRNSLPTLVNLWASWCAPCRKELPFLQKLNEEKSANITLINIEDTPEDAKKVLADLNINKLTTRYDAMELLDKLALQGLPSSILYQQNDIYLGIGVLKNEQSIRDWLHCLQKPTSE